ncbi:daunorubicin/doxorubicin resistance ABC transporter ATP-binding protein DrrA, partial [Streptomyces sp. NPDC059082]
GAATRAPPPPARARVRGGRRGAGGRPRPPPPHAAARIIGSLLGTDPATDADNRRVGAVVQDRVAALTSVARALDENSIEAEDIALRRPTLDEVFLSLTGNGSASYAEQRDKEVIPS